MVHYPYVWKNVLSRPQRPVSAAVQFRILSTLNESHSAHTVSDRACVLETTRVFMVSQEPARISRVVVRAAQPINVAPGLPYLAAGAARYCVVHLFTLPTNNRGTAPAERQTLTGRHT
jgi:hypothetical protein